MVASPATGDSTAFTCCSLISLAPTCIWTASGCKRGNPTKEIKTTEPGTAPSHDLMADEVLKIPGPETDVTEGLGASRSLVANFAMLVCPLIRRAHRMLLDAPPVRVGLWNSKIVRIMYATRGIAVPPIPVSSGGSHSRKMPLKSLLPRTFKGSEGRAMARCDARGENALAPTWFTARTRKKYKLPLSSALPEHILEHNVAS